MSRQRLTCGRDGGRPAEPAPEPGSQSANSWNDKQADRQTDGRIDETTSKQRGKSKQTNRAAPNGESAALVRQSAATNNLEADVCCSLEDCSRTDEASADEEESNRHRCQFDSDERQLKKVFVPDLANSNRGCSSSPVTLTRCASSRGHCENGAPLTG